MRTNPPLPIQPAPELVDEDLAPLLEPLAAPGFDRSPEHEARQVRERLLGRVTRSLAAESTMVTARRRRVARTAVAPGVQEQVLYATDSSRALRPGEPSRVRLLQVAAGAGVDAALLGDVDRHREWLVVHGRVSMDRQVLAQRDYITASAGTPSPSLACLEEALVFARESEVAGEEAGHIVTVLDSEAGWPDFVPGIQRRVLWEGEGQAALLYYAQPGAAVPLHSHGHDEECLMLQGELFLDDVLLQEGDYQLAPAGTSHHTTQTDTGVVIYAHSDLDLRFVAPA